MLYIYIFNITASLLFYQDGKGLPVFLSERETEYFPFLKGKTIAVAEIFWQERSQQDCLVQQECWEEWVRQEGASMKQHYCLHHHHSVVTGVVLGRPD